MGKLLENTTKLWIEFINLIDFAQMTKEKYLKDLYFCLFSTHLLSIEVDAKPILFIWLNDSMKKLCFHVLIFSNKIFIFHLRVFWISFYFLIFFHIKFIDNQIHFYLVSRDLNLNLNFKLIIECMKNIAWKSNVTIWHFQIYLTDVKSSLFDCFMIFHQIYFHFNITFIHYLNNYKNS